MEVIKTFKIPAENIGKLEFEISEVNKRVARLQKRGYAVELIAVETDKDNPIMELQPLRRDEITGKLVCSPDRIYFTANLLTSQLPKINGWEFVASLTHVEDVGTMIRVIPSVVVAEKELSVYRDAKPICDHCLYIRRRNETFVVRNPEGNLKQVGRNCLKSYTGIANPEMLCSIAEILITAHGILRTAETSEWQEGKGRQYVSIDNFMPYVVASVREFGWLSRKGSQDAGGMKPSTSDVASSALYDRLLGGKETLQVIEADRIMAKAIVDFCDEKFEHIDVDALSDYESNLRVAMLGKVLYPKMTGIVASAYVFYNNELVRREKNQEWSVIAKVSTFQGEVGKRSVFNGLKLINTHSWPTQYGVTHLYQFLDEANNLFVWFASSDQGFELGNLYNLKATVKQHNGYKGAKQTVLTRGVVQEKA